MSDKLKRRYTPLTPLELEIMRVLWREGSATVQEVVDSWQGKQKPAYTTIQTILTILYRKGKVARRMQGKAYRYAPKVTQAGAVTVALREMIQRFFGGSAEDLVVSLIENRQLSSQKLAELARMIEISEKNGER